ncbi:sugar phosphate isomerase/epimerase [Parapedobacter sp. ISTM3]|uniref:D-psicose/D-tagatose/L-ribulose 3-epimerase n=1 Tax=Parapedobacter luteus TaxID=623280 RepID=A0A1T5BRJ7_9SPHI|nr:MULTISPECIES: sugar phosphate isomerase/epimerase family protein [Parapedobacter]MBK1439728.1 sugar phosphate isomerase/epimerase [Parapedobacter sp. ISTM3]SKB49805.1 D-psicose/D-tagatose/L-ribulose 3-epimerase [Parapedobacter luteus]
MNIGISTFVWVSPFSTASFDILRKAKDIGYDVIEIAVEDRELIDWAVLRKTCREMDLSVTVSGAFGMDRDISNELPEIRANGLSYIIDCLEIASELESPLFGGPLYSAVGKTRLVPERQKQQERQWCLDNLYQAVQRAEALGVTLALEPLNRFETDMVNTVDQAIALVDEVGSAQLKILLDTFHSNIEEKNIPASIIKLGSRLAHIQANENDRGTPGTGHLDWVGICDALQTIGYQGSLVIETFGAPSKELARAASIWRPLAASADELAEEGFAFLKKTFTA